MSKFCNLTDMEIYRRSYSNALFNSHFPSFDKIFRMIDISLVPSLFVEERLDNSTTSIDYFNRFKIAPIIKTKKSLNTLLDNGGDVGSVYFLLGKKGVGKTTLLRHYFSNHLQDELGFYIFLDLYGMTASYDGVEKYIWESIRFELKKHKYSKRFFDSTADAKIARPLFNDVSSDKIAEFIISDSINYTKDVLLHISTTRRTYLIFDNSDELGMDIVENISRFGVSMIKSFPLRIIINLRDYWEEKILKKLKRQVQVNSSVLSPPKIEYIIKKRIENLNLDSSLPITVQYVGTNENNQRVGGSKDIKIEDINSFLLELIREAFEQDPTISNKLYRLCNYDIREVLDNMYNFFHSCKLPLAPLFQKIFLKRLDIKRKLSIDDFITCFLTIHTVCYDYKSSRIFNLFDMNKSCASQTYKNTLGLIRILQRCTLGDSQSLASIINDFIGIGYEREKLFNAITYLLEEGLLDSSQTLDVNIIKNIRISDKGKYYLEEMIFNFDYLLYIQDRVPSPPKYHISIESKFGDPHSKTISDSTWTKRRESVYRFISFLYNEEQGEENEYSGKNEILERIRGGTMQFISNQIKSKIIYQVEEIEKAYKYVRSKHDLEFLNIEPKYIKEEPSVDHGGEKRKYHDY